LVFEKNAIFSQKIVIITLTPGLSSLNQLCSGTCQARPKLGRLCRMNKVQVTERPILGTEVLFNEPASVYTYITYSSLIHGLSHETKIFLKNS
jgi:hypothetical protein